MSEVPTLLAQRMGGVAAEAIPLTATGLTWSVDPEDTLAFSASLSWPASGLVCALCSAPATAETAELLKGIAKEKSVIVVEHDMDFVRSLDVRVTVLHEGSVLSEGTLDHVSADPRVVEVYLGR